MPETVRTTINIEEHYDAVSVAVAKALAEAEDVAPDELDICLFEYVGINAIERVFDSSPPGISRCGTVSFSVRDYVVTIDVGRDDTADIRVSADSMTVHGRDDGVDATDSNANLGSV